MKIRRTLLKRMESIEGLGRGCVYEAAKDGYVLFSTNLQYGRLDIYVEGFSFVENDVECKILFADVSSIHSRLDVELFSNASRLGYLDFYVPLDVEYGLFHLSLSIPFLTYSNVMNILVGLREDWIKQVSSSG